MDPRDSGEEARFRTEKAELFRFLGIVRMAPNEEDPDTRRRDAEVEIVDAFCEGTLPLEDALTQIAELNQADDHEGQQPGTPEQQPDTPEQQLDDAIVRRAKAVGLARFLELDLGEGLTRQDAFDLVAGAMQPYADALEFSPSPDWVRRFAADEYEKKLKSNAKAAGRDRAFSLAASLAEGDTTRADVLDDIARAIRVWSRHITSPLPPDWAKAQAVQQLDEQLLEKAKAAGRDRAFSLAASLGEGDTTPADALGDTAQAMQAWTRHIVSLPTPDWVQRYAAQQLDIGLGYTAMRVTKEQALALADRIAAGNITRDAALAQIVQTIQGCTLHIVSPYDPGLVENYVVRLLNVTLGHKAKTVAEEQGPALADRIAAGDTTETDALAQIVQAMRAYADHIVEQAPALAAGLAEGGITRVDVFALLDQAHADSHAEGGGGIIREDLLAQIVQACVGQIEFPGGSGWVEAYAKLMLDDEPTMAG